MPNLFPTYIRNYLILYVYLTGTLYFLIPLSALNGINVNQASIFASCGICKEIDVNGSHFIECLNHFGHSIVDTNCPKNKSIIIDCSLFK